MSQFLIINKALYNSLFLCWRIIVSVWYAAQYAIRDKVKVHASSCTYYFLVSLIPVVIVLSWGMTAFTDKLGFRDNLELLDNIQLYAQIQSMASSLGVAVSSSAFKALGVVGIVYVIWGASSLMKAIRDAFMVIFPAETIRKGIITMIIAHIMIPLLMLMVMIISSLNTALKHAFRWLLADELYKVSQPVLASLLTPILMLLIIAVAVYACFMLLAPKRPQNKPAMMGSLLFAIYFMLLQHGFSLIMVKLIAAYSRYGASGSLLFLLLWAYMVFYGMFIIAEYVRMVDNFNEINFFRYMYAQLKGRPSFLEKIMMIKLPFGDNYYLNSFNKSEKKVYDGAELALCKVKNGELVVNYGGQTQRTLRNGEMYNQIGAYSLSVELTALTDSKVLIVSENGVKELLSRHPEAWSCISSVENIHFAYLSEK